MTAVGAAAHAVVLYGRRGALLCQLIAAVDAKAHSRRADPAALRTDDLGRGSGDHLTGSLGLDRRRGDLGLLWRKLVLPVSYRELTTWSDVSILGRTRFQRR